MFNVIHGRTTEILLFGAYITGSIPVATIKFFYNLVIMYWTLNSIYMQFEYRFPRSNTVSVALEHMQLSRGLIEIRNSSYLGGCTV